jgi:hypothetical protein
VLGAMPSGAFALRPSSQQNRLALSHSKGKNAVGHAIIHIHNGENNRYGYSIEDRDITYPTLEQLLSGLSDMRFDLVPPLTTPNGAPAVRSVSPPPVAKPAPLEKRQSAVTTGTGRVLAIFAARRAQGRVGSLRGAQIFRARPIAAAATDCRCALINSRRRREIAAATAATAQQQPPPQSPPPQRTVAACCCSIATKVAERGEMRCCRQTTTSKRTATRHCPMRRR